jgi:hypothetical protein
VGQDMPDKYLFSVEVDDRDQTILIAPDIEHDKTINVISARKVLS